jgi:hypothetical protein
VRVEVSEAEPDPDALWVALEDCVREPLPVGLTLCEGVPVPLSVVICEGVPDDEALDRWLLLAEELVVLVELLLTD